MLTLIGIALSTVVSGLVLGGLYTALAGEVGSVSLTLPWPVVGAILAVRGPALKTEGNLNNEVGLPLTLFRLRPEHVACGFDAGEVLVGMGADLHFDRAQTFVGAAFELRAEFTAAAPTLVP